MRIVIEKNIPLEPKTKTTGLTASVKLMEVGDSFVAPKDSQAIMYQTFNAIGYKCAVRTISDDQIRVWRKA
jgi:hypothetical protein